MIFWKKGLVISGPLDTLIIVSRKWSKVTTHSIYSYLKKYLKRRELNELLSYSTNFSDI